MAWCVAQWLHVCYLGASVVSLVFLLLLLLVSPEPGAAMGDLRLGRFLVANAGHLTQHALAMGLVLVFLGLPRTAREARVVHVASMRFLSLQLMFWCCIVRQVAAREVPMWLFWNGINGALLLQVTMAKARFDTVAAVSVTVRPEQNRWLYAFIAWNALFSAVHVGDIVWLVPGPLRGLKCVVLLQGGFCVIRSTKQLLQARLHWREARGRISWEQRSLETVALCIVEGFVCLNCSVLQSSLLLLVQRSLSLIDLALVARACIIVQQLVHLVRRYKQERTYTMLVRAALALVPCAHIPDDRRVCPVCQEDMHTAVRLDCGHHFHCSCVLSSLERVQVCPVCRAPVVFRRAATAIAGAGTATGAGTCTAAAAAASTGTVTGDGWLERVLNTLNATRYVASAKMVDEVAEVLPAVSRLAVVKDIAVTGSVDATIERLRAHATVAAAAAAAAVPAAGTPLRAPQEQQIQQLDDSLESVLWGEPFGLFTDCWRDCACSCARGSSAPSAGSSTPGGPDDSTDSEAEAATPRRPCPSAAFVQRKLELFRQACQRFCLAAAVPPSSGAPAVPLSDDPVL